MTHKEANSDLHEAPGMSALQCLTQHIRCWKCWRVFRIYLEPYEFEQDSLFRCEKCDILRALREEDFTGAFIRYFRNRASKTEGLFVDDVIKKVFRREFEKKWAETCACSGYFRCDLKPSLRCPHCGTKTPRWIPWPIEPEMTPLLPLLKYSVPVEYRAYAPTLPTRDEAPVRRKPVLASVAHMPWLQPVVGALIVLFLYLIQPLVWLSKLLGLLTKEDGTQDSGKT